MPKTCVVAIIVTFHPDREALLQLLDQLLNQVEYTVIVDNGSDPDLAAALAVRQRPQERFLPLFDNTGIAHAQNMGIHEARGLGAEAIVLFDQDSRPALDMVSSLLAGLTRLQQEGQRIAAIGPRYLDERQKNPPPFLQIRGLRLVRHQHPPEGEDLVPVDYLIASGCLIPMSTLEEVGGMSVPLFIDFVDIEWGLRASSMGFHSYGCFSATMEHALGDPPIRFLGKNYPTHSPLRHYYHFRNAVWLYQQKWVPLNWKLRDGWRLLLKYGFYSLFARPRHRHFLEMSRGLCHGLGNRLGRFDG